MVPTALGRSNTPDPVLRERLEKHCRESADYWVNNQYTVAVRRWQAENGDTVVHLSIHNHERTARHDWRDFQRIKNDILGPEEEAVEIYPAESRLIDLSNEFHLYSILGKRCPFGWLVRWVSDDGIDIGAKQRPWHPQDRPADCREVTRQDVEQYLSSGGER
jgi:hypothetical protein